MNDFELKQDVLDELRFDPQLDSAHIGVVAEDGVVTLTGHVYSYSEKLAAERATRRVKGVRAVAEEIEVRVPNQTRIADDEIARRVADILKLDSTIPNDEISITVHDGWVTLGGEVEWQFQRLAALKQVGKLSGLMGVINNITLNKRAQSADIGRQIEEALRRNARVDWREIKVSVPDGGKVILDGDVHGWDPCHVAEEIAWSVPGVASVDNRITVI